MEIKKLFQHQMECGRETTEILVAEAENHLWSITKVTRPCFLKYKYSIDDYTGYSEKDIPIEKALESYLSSDEDIIEFVH